MLATIVGIDEAGYGPMLGPLVVSAAAVEAPGDDAEVDLWEVLRGAVCRSRRGAAKKLWVADSKVVYQGGQGLDELERSVLGLLSGLGVRPGSFGELLGYLTGDAGEFAGEASWRDVGLPSQRGNDGVRMAEAEGLAGRVQGTAPVRAMASQVLLPGEFNRLVGRHGNKSTLLFQQNMILVERMMGVLEGDLHFVCDKHGGRHYYGELLAGNFFGSMVSAVAESPVSSTYVVRLRGRVLRFTFMEKADRGCLPAALASMVCKYVRELFMAGFNAYWCGRVAGLAPTAGYHGDSDRFLAAIRPLFEDGEEGRVVRER